MKFKLVETISEESDQFARSTISTSSEKFCNQVLEEAPEQRMSRGVPVAMTPGVLADCQTLLKSVIAKPEAEPFRRKLTCPSRDPNLS